MGGKHSTTQARPSCTICGNPCMSKGYRKTKKYGLVRDWRDICGTCYEKKRFKDNPAYKKRGLRKHKYLKYRHDSCDFCGFIPIHIGQLEVDHIDGNHSNDHIDNLQTLCCNCHRLKTILSWKKPRDLVN